MEISEKVPNEGQSDSANISFGLDSTVINEDIPEFTFKIDKNINEEMNKAAFAKNPSIGSDASENNSEIFLRPRYERKDERTISAMMPSPSRACNFSPRKTNSTGDLKNLMKYSNGNSIKNKNDNRVLQLVMPTSHQNKTNQSDSYRTSKHDIQENEYLKEQDKLTNYQHHQMRGCHINRAYSTGDLSGYHSSPSGGSPLPPRPVSTCISDISTPSGEKIRTFKDLLTKTLSLFYALFNVTLGLAVYVSDIVDESHTTSEIFSTSIVLVALLYITFLIIDISVFMWRKNKYEKLLEANVSENIEIKGTPEDPFKFKIVRPVINLTEAGYHKYCFSKDHHSANFYLKLGAAAFCVGHLIHITLLLGYKMVFLTSGETAFYECSSVTVLILDFTYPVYSFLLLFFIFKYSNIIINRNIALARFGVMHCLSSSICFWMWTIFREVLEAIESKKYDEEYTTDAPEPHVLPGASSNQTGAHLVLENTNFSLRRFTATCDQADETLSKIYKNISPYLYPFSVEFSILVVGIWYLVWQNIGLCEDDENETVSTAQCKTPSLITDNIESNVVIHIDCQASNKGIFAGFGVLIFTLVSSILFFIAVYMNNGDHAEIGLIVNKVTSLAILSLMMLACVFGYRQMTKLDVNTGHHILLDDLLLFICIPAYFLNGIFSVIPAVIYSDIIGSIEVLLEVCQVLIQTLFILDGVRRSSNTRKLRREKPGREMVTFLVISNVALWLMQTFEVKAHGLQDNRYEYYGQELWTILGHICLPLMMFYRFHSSVCFVDIWKYAYEPSGH